MVKAAVIGAGYLGKFHAEKYAASKSAELVSIIDQNAERAEECAKNKNCHSGNDYKVLPSLGVKCASVSTDTSTHYEISKWLLENGIDVLVEKPIAVNLLEAQSLIDIAKANLRILQVGHLERFNPAFLRISEVLTKPLFFEVRRIAQFTGRGTDVNVIKDLMIHDVDIVSHLVGRPLRRVEATGVPILTQSIDIASARLTFEGGCVANLTASRAAFKAERTIKIFQPDMYISLDFGEKRARVITRKPGATGTSLADVHIEDLVVEGDALKSEIESFVDCVKNRKEPVVGGEDGLRALAIVEQIDRAVVDSLNEYDPQLVSKFGLAGN
jgi:predicted dehydrogenase